MKTKLRLIFLRQELFTKGSFVLLAITLLAGGAIIFSDVYADTHMGAQAIVAAYTTLADIYLIYFSVVSFGKEFQYRTINMIRSSRLSGSEVIIRKVLDGVVLSVALATFLLGELALYKYVFHHPEVDFRHFAKFLYANFIIYGVFIYALANLVIFFVKNILGSFLSVYFGLPLLTFLTAYFHDFDNVFGKAMKYVPFEYVRGKFDHGLVYTSHEFWVLLVWTVGLVALLPLVYKKKGFV